MAQETKCRLCNGTGWRMVIEHDAFSEKPKYCHTCNGTGYLKKQKSAVKAE